MTINLQYDLLSQTSLSTAACPREHGSRKQTETETDAYAADKHERRGFQKEETNTQTDQQSAAHSPRAYFFWFICHDAILR
jgi:hypothetical protein